MPKARDFFTAEQQQQIVHAITEAEKRTSGEIRVHLEDTCSGDPVQRAQTLFHKLGMHKTDLHNGVLIYLAVRDRQFAIIGDAGIDAKVPSDFWVSVRNAMLEKFVQGAFADGLVIAIHEAGEKLAVYFPISDNDRNEVSNEISFRDV